MLVMPLGGTESDWLAPLSVCSVARLILSQSAKEKAAKRHLRLCSILKAPNRFQKALKLNFSPFNCRKRANFAHLQVEKGKLFKFLEKTLTKIKIFKGELAKNGAFRVSKAPKGSFDLLKAPKWH